MCDKIRIGGFCFPSPKSMKITFFFLLLAAKKKLRKNNVLRNTWRVNSTRYKVGLDLNNGIIAVNCCFEWVQRTMWNRSVKFVIETMLRKVGFFSVFDTWRRNALLLSQVFAASHGPLSPKSKTTTARCFFICFHCVSLYKQMNRSKQIVIELFHKTIKLKGRPMQLQDGCGRSDAPTWPTPSALPTAHP